MPSFESCALFTLPARVRRSLSVITLACCIAMLWAHTAAAAVSYSVAGNVYTQDFDTLPNTPTNASLGNSPTGWTDDNASPGPGNFSIEGWYLYHATSVTEGGFNGQQRLRNGSGNSATGAFYSFGANSSTDRALGDVGASTLAADGGNLFFGLRLTNDTGQTLTGFTLSFDGEQWRDSAVGAPETMTFAYSLTADSSTWATTGAFTSVSALNWTAPVRGTTAAAVNGNVAGKVTVNPVTIKNITWDPGTDLWLRWADPQRSGDDDGLAIDNVFFLADIFPVPRWTGTVNSDWNNSGNWSTGSVPTSGDTAIFDGPGNGNTTISLGGTRPIGSIQFSGASAAGYTLGSSSEQFDVDAVGAITVASDVTTAQTINAKINGLGGLFIANNSTDAAASLTIGSSVTSSGNLTVSGPGASTFNGPITNNSNIAVSGPGNVTFNGAIDGSGSVTSTSTGTLAMNAQNTYTGGTNINATVQNVIRIGASTVGSPGSVTSGPFGTGTVTFSGALPPILQPTGSDITIANTINFNGQAFFAATAPAAVDPSGVHSLTLTGPLTTVGNRTITNNIQAGGMLVLGSASSPSTLTLGGTLVLQTQAGATPGAGVIVVNNQISGAFGINAQNGATVYITNNNTISAESNVQNSATGQPATTTLIVNNVPVLPTDAGLAGGVAVRTGTLAGTGTIAGNSRLLTSSNGDAHLAPGNGAGTANGSGKLTFYNDLEFSGSGNCSGCFFDVEIGGLTAGTEYDQVLIGGTLTIGTAGGTKRGTLNVDLINSFLPTANATFEIMKAASRVGGEFANVNLPSDAWSVEYTSTSVLLHFTTAAGLLGDFNSDGKVDAGDYVTWRKNDTANTTLPNDNGLTTQADRFTLWRANFGNPPGAGSGLEGANVPEPGTFALLVMGAIALACPRRSLRSRNG